MFDPTIFICCRDRVSTLRELVAWLERAGHQRIVLLDNASTWEPLLDYLAETPHHVVRLPNLGARALWASGLAPMSEWFVYTDPDVVPTADCPHDAIAHLRGLLDRHAEYEKAGLGLYLDDVPASMNSLGWERSLIDGRHQIERGAHASDCMIDTTFALHRPATPHTLRAIRCGPPYQARHMPWYVTEPAGEDAYYLAHATGGPEGSSWADGHQRAA